MQLLRGGRGNFNSAAEILAYNCIMYQEIDEQDDDEYLGPARFSVLPFLIGAILAALVFFAVWLFSPGQQITAGLTVETPASRAAYLKALSERNPSVRRARLLDYQQVHPDTDRTLAIESQLDVINAAELGDWTRLNQTIYNDATPLEDKRQEMIEYELRWYGDVLGGRGEDLITLKQKLDDTKAIEALPDRRLEGVKSPIPENVPSDMLAGAPPQMAVTFPVYEPEPQVQPIPQETADVIVQPSVRRNVSPSYPKSAKRRKIGAVVTVSMHINKKGRVEEAELVDIKADRYQKDFIKASLRAAKRTRFNPKKINGQPVPAFDIRKRYIFKSD